MVEHRNEQYYKDIAQLYSLLKQPRKAIKWHRKAINACLNDQDNYVKLE